MNKLTGLVLASVAAVTTACGAGGNDSSQLNVLNAQLASSRHDADLAAVTNLEATVHRAQTTKNVDLLMSIWDRDATLTAAGKTYTGTQQIRDFWATTAPVFRPENNWIELTATFRMAPAVHGDQGTFRFECYFLDIPTKVVKGISVFDSTVVHRGDRWLLTKVTVSPLPLASLTASASANVHPAYMLGA